MVLPCRAQNRRVMTQFGLRMDRHRTANRWSHPDDAHSGTNFEHTAEPTVLDKTVSLVAGIDVDIRTEAARVEIRLGPQSPQIRERSAGNDVDGIFVEKIAPRWKGVAAHDRFEFLRGWPLTADPLEPNLAAEQLGENR